MLLFLALNATFESVVQPMKSYPAILNPWCFSKKSCPEYATCGVIAPLALLFNVGSGDAGSFA